MPTFLGNLCELEDHGKGGLVREATPARRRDSLIDPDWPMISTASLLLHHTSGHDPQSDFDDPHAALNRGTAGAKIRSDDAWRRVEPFKEADAARVRYVTTTGAQWFLNAEEIDVARSSCRHQPSRPASRHDGQLPLASVRDRKCK